MLERIMLIRNASRYKGYPASEEIRALLEKLQPWEFRQWVEKISVPRHFQVNPDSNEQTAYWLAQTLKSWGYDVKFQGRYRNVVATSPGIGKQAVLVGAHYDSVPMTPGADDNGSAVAAMLGCAKACAHFLPGLPVVFVAFNCEEDGLLGSSDWVHSFLPTCGYEVISSHILEMVGYASSEPGSQKIPPGLPIKLPDRGDFIGLLTNRSGTGLMADSLNGLRTYCPQLPAYGVEVLMGLERFFPVLHRSDHSPFWKSHIPCVMWTDTSEFRNPHYHGESDLPDTLNYEFLTNVCRALTAVVLRSATTM